MIKARLAGASSVTQPRLVPPPVVEARLVEGHGCRRRTARRGAGTVRRRACAPAALSGRPADRRPVRVRAAVRGRDRAASDGQCALGHGAGHRQGRVGLGAADAAAQAGAGRARPAARRAGRRRHLCRVAAQADLRQVGCPASRRGTEGQRRSLLRGGEPAAAARRRGDARPPSPPRSSASSPPRTPTTPSSSRSRATA